MSHVIELLTKGWGLYPCSSYLLGSYLCYLCQRVNLFWPFQTGRDVIVCVPLVNIYPQIKASLSTSKCWVKIYDIPGIYPSVEGLEMIINALDKLIQPKGYTWTNNKANHPVLYAKLLLELSLTHSKRKHLLLLVPGFDDIFTHAKITIDYLGKHECCPLCSHLDHFERSGPHNPLF